MPEPQRFRVPSEAETAAELRRAGPDGPIWQSAGVRSIWAGLARGWQRLKASVGVALLNAFPSTATVLLPEWIREYGLDTDPCTAVPDDEDEQRVAVTGAFAARGGQSAAYYVAVAAAMGIAIDIEEGPTAPYLPPEFGVMQFGDELAGERARYIWRVTAPAATSTAARASLECRINRTKPVHTIVEYVYE